LVYILRLEFSFRSYIIKYRRNFSTDSLGNYLWSSSENSENNAWKLNTNNGNLNNNNKDNNNTNYRVRAFLANYILKQFYLNLIL